MSELESRLAEIEGKHSAPVRRSNYNCDSCFAPMNIVGEEKLDRMDVLGQVVHKLQCVECGRVTRKIFTPDDDYI